MKVSKPSTLALLLLLGVSAGWAFLQVLRSNDSAAPELSWQSAPFILLFALLMLMVKRRINVLPVTFVGRLVLLAKSGSHGGGLLSGLYLGFALFQLPNLSSSFAQHQLWVSLVDAVSALTLAIVGIALERQLKSQNPQDE
ncbi:MAG: DUF3180 family protein [Actinobacteria bacterium]|jgi:hypothetical protein|nr:DUF3180 family protein [Actinomycetota bacterium]